MGMTSFVVLEEEVVGVTAADWRAGRSESKFSAAGEAQIEVGPVPAVGKIQLDKETIYQPCMPYYFYYKI